MQCGVVKNATRRLGKSQGFRELPVRDEPVPNFPNVNQMVTAWLPTPDELVQLNRGAPVHLIIMGEQHPPVILTTGDAPE